MRMSLYNSLIRGEGKRFLVFCSLFKKAVLFFLHDPFVDWQKANNRAIIPHYTSFSIFRQHFRTMLCGFQLLKEYNLLQTKIE